MSASSFGGMVYVGSGDHNLYALNAATAAKLWTFTTGGTVISSPAVANGMVYVFQHQQIYAFSLSGRHDARARPNRNRLHPSYHLPQPR
jgi:outer membrane protein assembly factor BamB